MHISIPLEKAVTISTQSLRYCVIPQGIICGKHHFVDLWARDSLFATFGANVCGMQHASKHTIETFLGFQRQDGLISYRIQRSPTTIGKYFGKPSYYPFPKPNFRSRQSGGIVPDGGLMAIIGAREYADTTNDKKSLRTWYPNLQLALSWYRKRYCDGLISEWFLCEWADAVLKSGKTLYTNVLYTKALIDMTWIAKNLDDQTSVNEYKITAAMIKKLFNSQFWNGSYYSDWIDYKRHDYFASHQNLLAVWFDIADLEQSTSIIKYAKKYCVQNFTLRESYPNYPWWRIPIQNYLCGIPDYHKGCLWIQPGIVYAIALWKNGQKVQAQSMLETLAKKIIEYGDVYEIYEHNGKPVKRVLYKGERSFAWSAGLFLYAYHLIYSQDKKT